VIDLTTRVHAAPHATEPTRVAELAHVVEPAGGPSPVSNDAAPVLLQAA
jgi:hypothetical protein